MNRAQILTTMLSVSLALGFAATASAQAKKGGKAAAKTPAKAAAPAAAPKAAATPVGENANALDLNSAPPEKLMTLTGVDMIVAKKIMAGRPYKNKNEIVAKKIMSQDDFNRIARGVTVNTDKKK